MTEKVTDKLVEDVATLKQQTIDLGRRIDSYHASIANYEAIRRLEKTDMERYVADQNKIQLGDIKEHINKVSALQKIDIEKSRDYCEEENRGIKKSISALKTRMDKVAYGTAGAVGVVSAIAWFLGKV